MAKCGCSADRCGCNFVAGDGIAVTGTGSKSNPYVVQATDSTAGGGEVVSNRFSGEIVAFGGPTPPSGWLMCDGAIVNRAVYAALFAVIGTSYGAGDGVTTFGLPNLSGAFPMGANGTYPRGSEGGTTEEQLVPTDLPIHNHLIDHTHAATGSSGGHEHDIKYSNDDGVYSAVMRTGSGPASGQPWSVDITSFEPAHSHTIPAYAGNSGNTGSSTPTAVNNLPPYSSVNYIVKI